MIYLKPWKYIFFSSFLMSKTYLSVQNIIMTKLDLAYNYAGMHDICYEPLALTASDSYVT